mmetsp:Transcript_20655/g.57363  ORF Transcript_20655/g.57363 Transcript_20655/m.57363 type:complete len:184 (+) Transcript_20655:444-995(+)
MWYSLVDCDPQRPSAMAMAMAMATAMAMAMAMAMASTMTSTMTTTTISTSVRRLAPEQGRQWQRQRRQRIIFRSQAPKFCCNENRDRVAAGAAANCGLDGQTKRELVVGGDDDDDDDNDDDNGGDDDDDAIGDAVQEIRDTDKPAVETTKRTNGMVGRSVGRSQSPSAFVRTINKVTVTIERR